MDDDQLARLAYKHLNRHPNDKSGQSFAKLRRQMGEKEADKLVAEVADTLELLGIPIIRPTLTDYGLVFYYPPRTWRANNGNSATTQTQKLAVSQTRVSSKKPEWKHCRRNLRHKKKFGSLL